jgi:hypothetical protein
MVELAGVVAYLDFSKVQHSALQVILCRLAVVYGILKVGKHFIERGRLVGFFRFWFFRYMAVYHLLGFQDGFMLGTFLPVHDKINHIQAFAMRGAIGAKAVCRMGFIVNLHARGFIFMEGAA